MFRSHPPRETVMNPADLLTIAAALGAGAFTKGVTGMGLPLVSLPFLVWFLGLPHALCVLVVPILVTNAWQVWRFRASAAAHRLNFLRIAIFASFIGMAAGTYALTAVDERLLVLALAGVIFAYVGLRLLRPDFVLGPQTAARIACPVGFAAGALQGATGISAPVAATYVHAMRLEHGAHVYALSWLFLAVTAMQVVALGAAGILRWEWLAEGVFALLPVALAMPLGHRLAARLDRRIFDRVILAMLAVIGLYLALDP